MALNRAGKKQPVLCARHGHVEQATLFRPAASIFLILERSFSSWSSPGEWHEAILHADDEDDSKFEPFRRMHGEERHPLGPRIPEVSFGRESDLFAQPCLI